MKVIMCHPIGEQKQHLFWCMYDDEEAELNRYRIYEFDVCDCFIDWTLHFRNENKNIVLSKEDVIEFFNKVPTEKAECDMFCIFGKVTIICCRNAVNTCSSCFSNRSKKELAFHCSSCQVNFCRNICTRFIRIKNDQNLA